jgi:hypothetical protein
VERPPHYDTFGEFQYAYHYGDMYAPYIKQEEPLKTECQHFLDCIKHGTTPISCGRRGTELVRILEASSESLRAGGGAINFLKSTGASVRLAPKVESISVKLPKVIRTKGRSAQATRKDQLKTLLAGAGEGNGVSNGNGRSNGHGH